MHVTACFHVRVCNLRGSRYLRGSHLDELPGLLGVALLVRLQAGYLLRHKQACSAYTDQNKMNQVGMCIGENKIITSVGHGMA